VSKEACGGPDWAGKAQEHTPLPQDVRSLLSENASLRKRLREQEGGEGLIIRAVEEAYQDPPDLVIPAPKKHPRRKSEEIALLHVTDWQLGKLTESYSVAVAAGRISKLAEKTILIWVTSSRGRTSSPTRPTRSSRASSSRA
jgi:hypothetical protein